MKASELKKLLSALPQGDDPDIVTGDEWLPEQLLDTHVDGDLLFMHFDTAPDESSGEEEGRGFVEHEIELIRQRLGSLLNESSDSESIIDALLALVLMAHEQSSSEVIERLEGPELAPEPSNPKESDE
ncbi:hypothetical protein H4F18_08065 [Vibrio scophthalmi]|uniref:hypothetical protein n=1 Tax=Vibrio scophthalmi TaxID=45658 RepID=UPI002FEFE2B8